MRSRYYDPNVGRFINADGYISTGQGLIGYNMYAYCNNNPIMYVDPNGEKTFSITFNLFAGLYKGVGVGVSLATDSKGKFAIQFTQLNMTEEPTNNIVFVASMGMGVGIQYTNMESIEKLEGPSKSIGANFGPGSFDLICEAGSNNVVGFAAGVGASVGADVHEYESTTKTFLGPFQGLIDVIIGRFS